MEIENRPNTPEQDPYKDETSIPQATVLSSDEATYREYPDAITSPSSEKSSKIVIFLESTTVTIVMTTATIYALFGDDIKSLGFEKSSDDVFSSLVVICLLLFSIELVLSFIFKPAYRWSFYFWLDLIATLSLVPDIGWLWDKAVGISSTSSQGKSLQNAGKASRAGTKTARALRIIRIVRLIRIVKLYKNAKIAMKKRETLENKELFKDLPLQTESRVGKKMSEVVMKRVIVIVLALLFVLPLFEHEFYFTDQTSWELGLEQLKKFLNLPGFEEVKDQYLDYHKNDIRPIVYLSFKNDSGKHVWESNKGYNELRFNEIFYASTGDFISIFDLRYDSKLTSLLNICRTVFICLVLTLASLYFTSDSEKLVIQPIEKMMEKVKIIAKNPIAASDIKDVFHEQNFNADQTGCFKRTFCKSNVDSSDFETGILETTILKIGVLLALGFGEAGSLIIGSNVELGGQVDPLTTGSKVICIYGFCDIRNFTDTTEELQEGVMMFVNEIAQVVHGIVDKYLGAANKNIGDAFLLVWKFSNDEMFIDQDQEIIKNPASLKARFLPDLSLLAFLKILAKVNKDPLMLKYRTNPKLLQRMPGYEIKMGFGLHIGWSIEGPIGSQFKIDASYLSPNVNLASALEGSTKIYGVPLLISENLFRFFSKPVKKYCRLLDRVFIKGNSSPIGLFTCDCDFSEFSMGKVPDRSKEYFRNKRKKIKKLLENGTGDSACLFSTSKEFSMMRKGFKKRFFRRFSKGVRFYLQGEWESAKEELKSALKVHKKDGPCLSLLSFMGESDFKAPESWEGARFL
jgi:class 3 adenylate cyclase